LVIGGGAIQKVISEIIIKCIIIKKKDEKI